MCMYAVKTFLKLESAKHIALSESNLDNKNITTQNKKLFAKRFKKMNAAVYINQSVAVDNF